MAARQREQFDRPHDLATTDWGGADRVLALTAVNEALGHVDAKQISKAQAEIAAGDSELQTNRPNRYESAIDDYRAGWRDAIKAMEKLDQFFH